MLRTILLLLVSSLTIGYDWKSMLVFDVHGSLRPIVCLKKTPYYLVENDIIIKDDYKSSYFNGMVFAKLGGEPWRDGIIYYTLEPDLPEATLGAIHDAIHIWETHTHFQFILITNLLNKPADYLVFKPDFDKTCASYVGRQGGEQPIILAKRCNTMNIVHEIGHAIGLWHEHSRIDRDNYVKILWDNISEQSQYNFNQHLSDGQDYGEYDYLSIMHYSAYAFSKNNQKTIIPLQGNYEIGQRKFLSPKDIATVNHLAQTN